MSTGSVQLGIGPSVDYVSSTQSETICGPFVPASPSDGPFFGVASHVAFVVARSSTTPDRGVGHVEVILQLHPTFATEGFVMILSAGLGVDWF
jgi:hypothetical protein